MSYTDYITHEKFQIHGCSVIKAPDGGRKWPRYLSDRIAEGEVAAFFDHLKYLQDNGYKIRFIAHNVLFDGAIARIKFDFIADQYFCTLAMVDAMYQGATSSGLDSCMKTLLGWESGKADIISKLKDIRTEDIPEDLWEELVEYADDDVRACHELYKRSYELPTQEHLIMDAVLKMFCDPKLVFNRDILLEACKEADDERDAMMAKALSYGATEEILKGNKLFPDFLELLGYEVPKKLNAKDKPIPALAKTDEGFIAMLEAPDERLAALAVGRLAVKSTQAQTRAYRFKAMDETIGLFMVAYNYARAHTWRITGANKVNPANLKRGSKLRTCIEAPEGRVLAVVDASQIECRGTGYLAGQTDLLRLFRDKQDPYNAMASDIFGRPVDRKGNPDDFFEGFVGKTAVLGLGFGMGGEKFKYQIDKDAKQYLSLDMDFPIHEANRIVYDVYRPKNHKIVEFWNRCEDMLYAMLADRDMVWNYGAGQLEVLGKDNRIYFPNGTWLYYAGLDCDNGQFTYLNQRGNTFINKKIYGSLLTENIVQKFARDITSHHMVVIGERYPVVMHTYDENIALVPEDEADEALEWMIKVMCTPPPWAASIPLDAEGGYAKEYSK
jgi:DNA polymerase